MAIRNTKTFTFRPRGLTDDVDASSAFPGSMGILQNIVQSPNAVGQFIPRTAAAQLSNFSGFSTPTRVSALLIIGNFAWGMVASARNAGKDEPFCYNMATGAFVTIANVTAANVPTTPAASGDWTPPVMAAPSRGRIIITHPGYSGANFIGWIDISNFASTALTGSTHTSTLIDTLSANPITVGWEVGMRITGAGIPVNTFITALTSTSVTLSQAATATAAGVALTVTGGTPAAPIYGAGNVNGNPFTVVPTCVAGFNGRAWYGVQNYAVYSDTLNSTQITAASQALQIGDDNAVTAMAPLPLSSPISGGTTQSLIVFKGAGPFTQITGDAATANLAQDEVAGSVGTLAPNTLSSTPDGLYYVAPDGLRFVTLAGTASEIVGDDGEGVNVPFLNVVSPSRMCAAYNQNTLRVSLQNALAVGQAVEEYWFRFHQKVWSGPHTFPAALIRPYYGAAVFPFISFASGVDGKLWSASALPIQGTSYTENGTALTFVWQTALLPDNEEMAMNAVVETTLAYQMPATQMLQVIALDEDSNILDQIGLSGSNAGGTIWNSFNWNAGVWGSSVEAFQQHALNWTQPLVFKQARLRLTGACLDNFILSDLRIRYQVLGYTLP